LLRPFYTRSKDGQRKEGPRREWAITDSGCKCGGQISIVTTHPLCAKITRVRERACARLLERTLPGH
jgi:hypothetical protein